MDISGSFQFALHRVAWFCTYSVFGILESSNWDLAASRQINNSKLGKNNYDHIMKTSPFVQSVLQLT